MEIEEIINVHAKAKININLAYKRKSGRENHCYIPIDKPLYWRANGGYSGQGFEAGLEWILKHIDTVEVRCFKHNSHAEIWVKPENLRFQNEKKAKIVRVLYGKSQV